jgi:hypothetical protein
MNWKPLQRSESMEEQALACWNLLQWWSGGVHNFSDQY